MVICYYGAFHTLVQDSVLEKVLILCVEQCDINVKPTEITENIFFIGNSELLYFQYIYSLYINTVSFPKRRIVFQEYCLFPCLWGGGHGW